VENKTLEQEQAGEKIEAIAQADATLEEAGLPTYTQLIATIDGLTAYEVHQ
jgi:hypothetical protein